MGLKLFTAWLIHSSEWMIHSALYSFRIVFDQQFASNKGGAFTSYAETQTSGFSFGF
jgi:hypothetical protein